MCGSRFVCRCRQGFFLARFGGALSAGFACTRFFRRLFFGGFTPFLAFLALLFFSQQRSLVFAEGLGAALFFGTALGFGGIDDFYRLRWGFGFFLPAFFGRFGFLFGFFFFRLGRFG